MQLISAMSYKESEKTSGDFERYIVDEIFRNLDSPGGKASLPNENCLKEAKFELIVADFKNHNTKEVQKRLVMLAKVVAYHSFKYTPDFVESGFADLLIQMLGEKDYAEKAVKIVINLSRLEPDEGLQYIRALWEKDMFVEIWNMFQRDVPKILMSNLMIILMNCALIHVEFRDSIVERFELEFICKSSGVDPDLIIKFFLCMLTHKFKDENEHRAFIEPFKFIWNNFSSDYPDLVLRLFAMAVLVHEALDIFICQQDELIRQLVNMLESNASKILIYVLFLCKRFVKYGDPAFEIVAAKIDRIIKLVGNETTRVAQGAVKIINYLLKNEPTRICERTYDFIVRNSFLRMNESPVQQKRTFLSCIFLLLPNVSEEVIQMLLKMGFSDTMADLIGCGDNEITLKVLSFVSNWNTTRQDELGSKMFDALMGDGGIETMQEFADSNGEVAEVAKEMIKIATVGA